MSKALNVLCLDIEGWHGGSSRSLYYSLKYLDRNVIQPEVWYRRDGFLKEKYDYFYIPSRHYPAMPVFSSLSKLSRNIYALCLFATRYKQISVFLDNLLEIAHEFDLIHLNHEGLFIIAGWLRRKIDKPVTMHIRTKRMRNFISAWQTRVINVSCKDLVFITENEENNYRFLGGTINGKVIYNIAEKPVASPAMHPAIADLKTFNVACLANYSWNRGIDRLIDIADILKELKRTDIIFIVAGDMTLPKSLPGKLGEVAKSGGNLFDYAYEMGVSDQFVFLGHVSEPERVLAGCQALIKPSRENNPWGRDVLEALAMGKPVISFGSYERFVENDHTGLLFPSYDANDVANGLISFADNPLYLERLAEGAIERTLNLCNGPERANDLAEFWLNAAAYS